MSLQSISHSEKKPVENGSSVAGEFCDYRGQRFYKIENYDQMPNFFMSVVSAYDHWLFVSSNGGLTAGRQNAQRSLFPYYTEDKISDMAHCTGALTLIKRDGQLWRPFESSSLTGESGTRTLYKSALGDQLFFVEKKDGLQFEYGWSFSESFGLVRTATLTNMSDSDISLSMLDGLQNILPSNVTSDIQNESSVLLDAYKSSDCYNNNIAAFSLSSRLTDLAEPAESLTANTVWHSLSGNAFNTKVSIDSNAPKQFVTGATVDCSERQRGQRGAYFIEADIALKAGEKVEWFLVSEVDQDGSKIQQLQEKITAESINEQLLNDVLIGTQTLQSHLAKTDALQATDDELTVVHHQANALFNMMRGGFFEDGYVLERDDIVSFVKTRRAALSAHVWWASVPEKISVVELEVLLSGCDSTDLKRLVREYLPISFSRRHGDPSRPWNKFSINLKNESGDSIKDYQGNWRDIFQNWEPLAYSYPKFLPGMISAFLNATTADGYNPYRVTRDGIEWEEPEEGNDWANIGYWSDHQIIYLSKLLELQTKMDPTWLTDSLTESRYTYANVPYRIKPFADLKNDPYDSIDFDEELNTEISKRVAQLGTDGKLLPSADGGVVHVNLIEKLLTLWLAKLSNFVPEGGVWMNTQRPEWNDANNALVGWGLSVVTVNYLHRHLSFMRKTLDGVSGDFALSAEVKTWFDKVHAVYQTQTGVTSESRYSTLETLSGSGDEYRASLYMNGLSDGSVTMPVSRVLEFLDDVLPVIAHTLKANRRDDALYHGYNLLHLNEASATVEYLPLMLEGQVAVLSADLLTPDESLEVLSALRRSDLYREDQHTYVLYPNKILPSFIDKNQVSAHGSEALSNVQKTLLDARVLYQSNDGVLHFNVAVRNAKDLQPKLEELELSEADIQNTLSVYEQTFKHKSFTGRSGSFFGYEGLGSTYWHMVSKLLLAAQENWLAASEQGLEAAADLESCYYDVRAGIGFNKTPEEYGAFPTDPYSHTPETGIARQPGMTGQVKEELITRFGELGLQWHQGTLVIKPGLLRATEFLKEAQQFSYLGVDAQWNSLSLVEGSLAFTMAQVPFVYRRVAADQPLVVSIELTSGERLDVAGSTLPAEIVEQITQRNGAVKRVDVDFPVDNS
jgi:hypothetical protein